MPTISKSEIIKLLDAGELIISPILDIKEQIEYGSINIRLGCKFIRAQRSRSAIIAPQKATSLDLKKTNSTIRRGFGERYILHPGQFVLGSTFEFIKLPINISAFVLSRSSFGRDGLLIATATYIHPDWQGCLTLELINQGSIPIELRCGAPIGQLVLQKSKMINVKDRIPLKHIPLDPEISVMNKWPDWAILKSYSSRYKSRF